MPEQLPGYVYALINHAMPGLVKVGLTTRDPLGRLGELSSATGVPTPFELVFDILVADAQATEERLHDLLTKAGYRVADNREFFRAPIHEVVRLMLQLRESDSHASLRATSAPAPGEGKEGGDTPAGDRDSRFREAAELCIQNQLGSTSLLQRSMSIGYGRAARIIDQLFDAGILGPPDGAKPREVLIGMDQADEYCS
jgi:DNA segregation ATPase FtsK/SpoIIIE-like protein